MDEVLGSCTSRLLSRRVNIRNRVVSISNTPILSFLPGTVEVSNPRRRVQRQAVLDSDREVRMRDPSEAEEHTIHFSLRDKELSLIRRDTSVDEQPGALYEGAISF